MKPSVSTLTEVALALVEPGLMVLRPKALPPPRPAT
jgi:hypothetical protein